MPASHDGSGAWVAISTGRQTFPSMQRRTISVMKRSQPTLAGPEKVPPSSAVKPSIFLLGNTMAIYQSVFITIIPALPITSLDIKIKHVYPLHTYQVHVAFVWELYSTYEYESAANTRYT